jgi:N-acetyl-anhydromuramyl-L-alanine amidase AmpD
MDRILATSILLICLVSCSCCGSGDENSRLQEDKTGIVIRDHPIQFGPLRKRLTLEYMRRHYDAGSGSITIVPRMIVIHWTAINSLEATFSLFNHELLPPARRDVRHGGRVNVSAHFLVDRDGTIYRLMPETWMARHCIGLNHCAIGIENIGGPHYPLTDAQLEANVRLVTMLMEKYPAIEQVIGHHEYLSYRSSSLWKALDSGYRAHGKIDPGAAFMKRLRKRLGQVKR